MDTALPFRFPSRGGCLFLVVFCCCLPCGVRAQTPLPSDSTQAPAPTAVSIPPLPDGWERALTISPTLPLRGMLAFMSVVAGYPRIFVLDLENRRVKRLIDGPGKNSAPSWSPDGARLAFSSTRDGNAEIYVADWDGDHQRRLTANPAADDYPDWSSDGAWIVFQSEEGGNASNFWKIRPDGTDLTRVTSLRGRNSSPRWSPDGKRIAYATNRFWPGSDICIWHLEKKLETCPLHGSEGYARPSWSRKGDALGYSAGTGKQTALGIFWFAESREEPLPARERRDFEMVWSPLGDYIAFTEEGGEDRHGSIQLYSKKSGEAIPLLVSPDPVRYLSWSGSTALSLEAKRAKASEAANRR